MSRPASIKLLCFHHAGGSAASYNSWSRALPDWIEVVRVQLPGRDPAGREPRHTRVQTLLPELYPRLVPLLDRPFALYGHSLGALVAFELARALRAAGEPAPLALFVSGRRAPQMPLALQALHDMPEHLLIPRLIDLGGIARELADNHKWLSYFLPVMRSDLEISDRYAYTPGEPLACPIFAFKGEADPLVTEAESHAWRAQTSGAFAHAALPGRHFCPPAATALLQAAIAERLSALAVTTAVA